MRWSMFSKKFKIFNLKQGKKRVKSLEKNSNSSIMAKAKKLDKLVAHPNAVVGDSDDFISFDWSKELKL